MCWCVSNVRVLAVYLAEGFSGVPVRSAKSHYHVHSKTPHHVVLQVSVRREDRKLSDSLTHKAVIYQ